MFFNSSQNFFSPDYSGKKSKIMKGDHYLFLRYCDFNYYCDLIFSKTIRNQRSRKNVLLA